MSPAALAAEGWDWDSSWITLDAAKQRARDLSGYLAPNYAARVRGVGARWLVEMRKVRFD